MHFEIKGSVPALAGNNKLLVGEEWTFLDQLMSALAQECSNRIYIPDAQTAHG